MRQLVRFAIGVSFTVLTATSAVANDEEFSRPGPYLGLGGTLAFQDFDNGDVEGDFAKDAADDAIDQGIPIIGAGASLGSFDDSLGFNVRAGYRFHPNFSAELEYEWLDEFNTDGSVALADALGNSDEYVGKAKMDGWLLTVNGKVHFVPGRFQPFLLVGAGYMSGETSAKGVSITTGDKVSMSDDLDGFVARFGGGLDIYIMRNLAFSIEGSYVLPTYDLEDYRFWSLSWGLQFRL